MEHRYLHIIRAFTIQSTRHYTVYSSYTAHLMDSSCLTFLLNFQVIAAEGEHKASRALREASEVISDSPAALQLRYLQVR